MRVSKGSAFHFLTFLILAILAGNTHAKLQPFDRSKALGKDMVSFFNMLYPGVDYSGDEVGYKFRPENDEYQQAISMISVPAVFFSFLVLTIGIIVMCMQCCCNKIGGCSCHVSKSRNAIVRKVILLLCGLLIAVGVAAGGWSNFYLHAAMNGGGVHWIQEVAQNFNSSLASVLEEADLLGITNELPAETSIIVDKVSAFTNIMDIAEDWTTKLEFARYATMNALYGLSGLLCVFSLFAILWYHKFMTVVIFFYGTLLLTLVWLWIGVFQVPVTVMMGTLCSDFSGNIMQYVPNDQYFHYYINCEGENPFGKFLTDAQTELAKLQNQTNPDQKTKQEIAELKILISGLNNMTCNSNTTEYSTNGLFNYEKGLICTNLMSDFAITTFAFVLIAIVSMILIYAGIKHNFKKESENDSMRQLELVLN